MERWLRLAGLLDKSFESKCVAITDVLVWRGGRAPVWRDRSRRSPVPVAERDRSA